MGFNQVVLDGVLSRADSWSGISIFLGSRRGFEEDSPPQIPMSIFATVLRYCVSSLLSHCNRSTQGYRTPCCPGRKED